MSPRTGRIAPLFLLLCAHAAQAAITVGAGSKLDLGDAALALGCGDLVVAGQASSASAHVDAIANLTVAAGGTLAPGAGQFSLGGDFADAGTFAPGTSRIAIVDACGSGASHVSGSTSFYDFAVSSASAKQLVLPAALAQNVAHALILQGAAGNLLRIVSSSAGQQALLAVSAGAAQSIAYVDVRDNKASVAAIAPGTPAQYQSVDGGNLANWFGAVGIAAAPVPAPSLNTWGLLLLGLSAVTLALRRLRA